MPSPSQSLPVSPELKKAWSAMKKQLDLISEVHGEKAASQLLKTLSKDPSMDIGKALFSAITEGEGRNSSKKMTKAQKGDVSLEDAELPPLRRPGFPGRVD